MSKGFIIQHPNGSWLAAPSRAVPGALRKSAAMYRLVPKYTLARRHATREEAITICDQLAARRRGTWYVYDIHALQELRPGVPARIHSITC